MKVHVTTGSRLHFGLICGTSQTGWQFGGVGLMLRQPSWEISISIAASEAASKCDSVSASPEATLRTREFLAHLRQTHTLQPVDVTISAEVPFHTGLGGGTQLGLALAAAAELICGRATFHNPWRLAQLAHRAERSAVGTAGFRDGGFLIDHGQSTELPEQQRVSRVSIPEAWRFVLVRPEATQGLSGIREQQFFNRRVEMPDALVDALAKQIQLDIVPAIESADFNGFAAALQNYGDAVGDFYAPEQGDVFAHPAVRTLVRQLRSCNIVGAAQSSWGPGICLPARSPEHANEIVQRIPRSIESTSLQVSVSEPLNIGATVRTTAPESSTTQYA